MIRTISKRPRGHLSAGLFHHPETAGGSRFGDEELSAAQIAALEADPDLTVERDDEPLPGAPSAQPGGGAGAPDHEEIEHARVELERREADLGEREAALKSREEAQAERIQRLEALEQAVKEPDIREAVLRAAIARVVNAGRKDDLTKDKKPKTEAVEAEVPGLDITAGERDRWFEELTAAEK